MNNMDKITIYDNVYTSLTFHLEDFDFTGIQKVIFTIRNSLKDGSDYIVVKEFTESKIYTVLITPEEASLIKNNAYYDFNEIIDDGSRLKISDTGTIIKENSVGRVGDSEE